MYSCISKTFKLKSTRNKCKQCTPSIDNDVHCPWDCLIRFHNQAIIQKHSVTAIDYKINRFFHFSLIFHFSFNFDKEKWQMCYNYDRVNIYSEREIER